MGVRSSSHASRLAAAAADALAKDIIVSCDAKEHGGTTEVSLWIVLARSLARLSQAR